MGRYVARRYMLYGDSDSDSNGARNIDMRGRGAAIALRCQHFKTQQQADTFRAIWQLGRWCALALPARAAQVKQWDVVVEITGAWKNRYDESPLPI